MRSSPRAAGGETKDDRRGKGSGPLDNLSVIRFRRRAERTWNATGEDVAGGDADGTSPMETLLRVPAQLLTVGDSASVRRAARGRPKAIVAHNSAKGVRCEPFLPELQDASRAAEENSGVAPECYASCLLGPIGPMGPIGPI